MYIPFIPAAYSLMGGVRNTPAYYPLTQGHQKSHLLTTIQHLNVLFKGVLLLVLLSSYFPYRLHVFQLCGQC